MRRVERILYVGTYERDYPRNALVIDALRHAGVQVKEIHTPVWERIRDKSGLRSDPVGIARLLVNLMTGYVGLALALLRHGRRCDVVMFGYPGHFDVLALGWIARLRGRPVVFNALVTLTDTIVEDRELLEPSGITAQLVHLLDRASFHMPERVLIDTWENGEYLVSRIGVPQGRIAHVSVGADESLFDPERWRGLVSEARAASCLRVLFYGKLIPLHGIETIVDAIGILAGDEEIRFEIIGSGQLDGLLRERLARIGNRRVAHLPWVAYYQLPGHIAAAGCVLGVFGTGDKAGRVVPNKVYQAMAMGAPIITRRSPAVQRILTHGESALLIPPGDPRALADAIREMRDPCLRARLGEGARVAFLRTGSRAALSRQLLDALRGISTMAAADDAAWSRVDGVSCW